MKPNRSARQSAYILLLFQIVAHLGLVYLCFFGKYWHFIITFLIYFITGCLGMTMTYHRLLSHKSYNAGSFWTKFGVICGTLGITGSAISWVAIHRQHHKYSETSKDPHAPSFKGWFYSHFLSMFSTVHLRFVTDLIRDKFLVFQHRYYFQIVLFYLFLLYLIDPFAVIYAGLAPAAILWNCGSLIVSFSHRGGVPHNDIALALLVWGEGNHLSHHQRPQDFKFGRIDFAGWLIERLIRLD